MAKYKGHSDKNSFEEALQNAIGQAIKIETANTEEKEISFEVTKITGKYSLSNDIYKELEIEITV
jgi:hypothetical protein